MKANKMIKALLRLDNQEESCEVVVHALRHDFNPVIRRGINSNGKKFILINLLERDEFKSNYI